MADRDTGGNLPVCFGGALDARPEQIRPAAAAAQNTLKIRYVCIVLAAVPIFAITPFVQKYLVAGTMLGAVKG